MQRSRRRQHGHDGRRASPWRAQAAKRRTLAVTGHRASRQRPTADRPAANEDGTIPKTSQWANNWTKSELNNFRQNVPGTQNAGDIGDLTAKAVMTAICDGSSAVLAVPVCNRGTAPVGAGISVGYYANGEKVCSAKTTGPLQVGECETVSCTWNMPPAKSESAVDVTVIPNDDGAIAQCNATNDKGVIHAVYCRGVN